MLRNSFVTTKPRPVRPERTTSVRRVFGVNSRYLRTVFRKYPIYDFLSSVNTFIALQLYPSNLSVQVAAAIVYVYFDLRANEIQPTNTFRSQYEFPYYFDFSVEFYGSFSLRSRPATFSLIFFSFSPTNATLLYTPNFTANFARYLRLSDIFFIKHYYSPGGDK